MSQWTRERPRLVLRSIDQIDVQLMRWRSELPSRHHHILNPRSEFVEYLRALVRLGYCVIALSRSKEKGARWNELAGTVHHKSKVNFLDVVKKIHVNVHDPYERGTLISLHRGVHPTTIYRRKAGGPDLPAMKDLLVNPLTV